MNDWVKHEADTNNEQKNPYAYNSKEEDADKKEEFKS